MTNPTRGVRLLLAAWLASITIGCSFPQSSQAGAAGDERARAERVVVVRFKSRLGSEEIRRRYLERMPQFRELPGLVQKYYLHDDETDEWCGIYLWDSQVSASDYLKSDLRKTIAAVYGVLGTPRVETFRVADTLR